MTSPYLQVQNGTKIFGGLVAVNNVDLDLYEGEILGLIGPNGAGKTTLFNLIGGTIPPTSGKIIFRGVEITGLQSHKICKLGIARTFQIVKPFAKLTVVDNVIVGAFLETNSPDRAEKKAREIIDFVGLRDYAEQQAQVLTTVGRKRLELARALATNPRVLLLDETMAGLTPTESMQIVNLIKSIRDQGITLLVIEHVMKAIMSLSDRVAVLHHGELIAVEKPERIASDQDVIKAYLGEEYQLAEN